MLIGLAAGIAVGLFVGERAAALQIVGRRLRQAAADDGAALRHAVARRRSRVAATRRGQAARLGSRVAVLLSRCGASRSLGGLLPSADVPAASRRRRSSARRCSTRAPPFDLIGLYIPANPFNALANNIVPAVVLFSALLGIALIGVPGQGRGARRDRGPEPRGRARRPVHRRADAVRAVRHRRGHGRHVRSGAGRAARRSTSARYVAIALLLSFWVLPGLVARADADPAPRRAGADARRAGDGVHDRQPVRRAADARRADAGAAARVHADLPPQRRAPARRHHPGGLQLPAHGQAAVAQLRAVRRLVHGRVDVAVALSRARRPPACSSLFGSVNVAVPFLLDMFRIPGRHVPAVPRDQRGERALRHAALGGAHDRRWRSLGTCAVAGVRACRRAQAAALRRDDAGARGGDHRRHRPASPAASPAQPYEQRQGARRHAGAARPRQRAGLHDGRAAAAAGRRAPCSIACARGGCSASATSTTACPTSFTNEPGELVGFDVEMALQLARDLGVGLELVPVDRQAARRRARPVASATS